MVKRVYRVIYAWSDYNSDIWEGIIGRYETIDNLEGAEKKFDDEVRSATRAAHRDWKVWLEVGKIWAPFISVRFGWTILRTARK